MYTFYDTYFIKKVLQTNPTPPQVPEGPTHPPRPLCGYGFIHPHDAHPVPRFTAVRQIILHDHIDGPGQLSRWRVLRHLLDGQTLVVTVLAQTELSDQQIAGLVL